MRLVVGEADAGERLDQALASLAGISRSQARRWIDEARVRVGGAAGRASQRVAAGELLEAEPPEPSPSPLAPEPIALAVLHEDADLIVIDKPAGLVVHPAPGWEAGTLVNALLHHCGDLSGVGGVLRPGIVHRLDRGTSGVLVAAKHDAAHRALAKQFADHSVEREYRALVRGLPGSDAGRVDRPLGRHPRDRKRFSVEARGRVREAHTAWRVVRRFAASERTLLAVLPETGRTHQIRVHLASAGLPLVGDPVYGRGSKAAQRPRSEPQASGVRAPARAGRSALDRPALHAAVLGFAHPRTGARLRFEAPLPADLASLMAELESREAAHSARREAGHPARREAAR
jgi:23S rRNA pseudouridine1911/1915/1917 synthase